MNHLSRNYNLSCLNAAVSNADYITVPNTESLHSLTVIRGYSRALFHHGSPSGDAKEASRGMHTFDIHRDIQFDARQQQMMGPEAMGVANANLTWSDEKVCRNFLCGTCPHALFTNTVSTPALKYAFLFLLTTCLTVRKWTSVPVQSRIPSDSKLNF